MDYNKAIEYIHGLLKFGSRPGLDRIGKLLSLMDNPQDKLKFIHVAGTNGKGSVTSFCARIMQNAGYKTGLFISPYVLDFRERIQINGEYISEKELSEILEKIIPHIEYLNSSGVIITEFEIITAIAFEYFYRGKCDIVCLETGLGGTYDSTNIIKKPEISVITSVSTDHCAVLGNAISEIAAHKAGIIKERGKVVCYPLMNEDALAVIMEKSAAMGASVIVPNTASIKIINSSIRGSEFCYGEKKWITSMIGKHQVYNAVTAVEAVKNCNFPVSDYDIEKGLRETILPARFEIVSENPFIVLDGGHNPEGAEALADTIKLFPGTKITAVMGLMKDKDAHEIAAAVAPLCENIIATGISGSRTLPPEELYEILKIYNKNAFCIPEQGEALTKAVQLTKADEMILICGSFYLAGEIKKIIAI